MHEAMVAQSILTTILAEARKQCAKPVSAKISCGMMNVVSDELLREAFTVLAQDTCCENIGIEIEHKPLRAKCRDCNCTFDFDLSSPKCPECQSDDFELMPDEPLILETIEFEMD